MFPANRSEPVLELANVTALMMKAVQNFYGAAFGVTHEVAVNSVLVLSKPADYKDICIKNLEIWVGFWMPLCVNPIRPTT